MDTFNTAIWRKDVRAVYILYSKNKWGIPDIYDGDDEVQPITVNQKQYNAIKEAGIEVDVIQPPPR
jgi:hypothetical protein